MAAKPDAAQMSLDQLLEAVAAAPGLDRVEYIPLIAVHGREAVDGLAPWLDEPDFRSFAVRGIVASTEHDDAARAAAISIFREHLPEVVDQAHAHRVRAALASLQGVGATVPKNSAEPGHAVIVGSDPFAPAYRPPLSISESDLLRRFLKDLPGGWRIYVRPHLDGDRPALALLHPERGAMLWHVRPGSLRDVIGEPRHYRTREGATILDPVGYVNALRQRIYGDYLPAWAEAIDEEPRRFGIVRAGVYLPEATEEDIRRLGMAGRYEVVINSDQLRRYTIDNLVPNAFRATDMEDGWFEILDARFSEYHPPTFGGITPTKRQSELIGSPLEAGWRGIEGVAGAGKSTVLAWRAAKLAREDRSVLLVTYNQTLANYCRGLADAAPDRYLRANLVVQHFHGLCHVIHRAAGVPPPLHPAADRDGLEAANPTPLRPMDDAERDHYERIWPASTIEALSLLAESRSDFAFDSVLVDEAQDFSPEFFAVIKAVLKPGGEVVLAFDRAQRLYARADGVRANLDMRRIKGLGGTRRLRQRHAEIASALSGKRKLPTDPITLDDDAPVLFSEEDAQWVSVGNESAAVAAAVDIVMGWQLRAGYRTDATVILVPSARLGRAVVEALSDFEIESNHIFPSPKEAGDLRTRGRRRKASFTPNDQRIKVATIHSYKGWEADDVMILEPHAGGETAAAVFYVALTRPKSRLVVIASRDDYGLRPMFVDLLADPDDAIMDAATRALAAQEEPPKPKSIGPAGSLDHGEQRA